MSDEQRRLNEINRQQGSSTWLNTLSIKEEGYTINKNCFCHPLRLRYEWQVQQQPVCVGPVSPWTTLFLHAKKEAL